jgi:hypothetical protein
MIHMSFMIITLSLRSSGTNHPALAVLMDCYHMIRLLSEFEWISEAVLTDENSQIKHSIAVEDPREMTSGIYITCLRKGKAMAYPPTFRDFSASEAQCLEGGFSQIREAFRMSRALASV